MTKNTVLLTTAVLATSLALFFLLPASSYAALTAGDCAPWDTVELKEGGGFKKRSEISVASSPINLATEIKKCVYGSDDAKKAAGAVDETAQINPDVISDKFIDLLQFVLGFLSLVAVAMIIYGGLIWMTSGGNDTTIDRARKILFAALIGLLITASSWFIVTFVIETSQEAFGVAATK